MSRESSSGIVPVVSRRKFAAGVVASTASLIPLSAIAQGSEAAASDGDLGPKPNSLTDADWGEVKARYANILRVYGSGLSSQEKTRLGRILTTNQHMLASIRSFHVANGDPSACTLRLKV